jgi:flagellin-like hook-associated protein FlgL
MTNKKGKNGKKRTKDEVSPGSVSDQPEKRSVASDQSHISPLISGIGMESPGSNTYQTSPQIASTPYMGQYFPPHLQLLHGTVIPPLSTPGSIGPPTSPTTSSTVPNTFKQPWYESMMSKLTSIETHQKSIETKLSKLDKLESEMCKISQKISSVETRVLSLETKVTDTNSRLTEMEVSRNFDTHVCDDLGNKHKQLEKLLKAEKDENAALAKTVEKLKLENKSMSDDIVDVRSRLMKDNLLLVILYFVD